MAILTSSRGTPMNLLFDHLVHHVRACWEYENYAAELCFFNETRALD
jgi:hypothetical protein